MKQNLYSKNNLSMPLLIDKIRQIKISLFSKIIWIIINKFQFKRINFLSIINKIILKIK